MCAIFQISGKCPISNKLLYNLDKEKEIGVDIKRIDLPDTPQYDEYDLFIFLTIFAITIGEVFNIFKEEIPSFLCKTGTGSSGFGTEDFEAKKLLKILLFSVGSLIIRDCSQISTLCCST